MYYLKHLFITPLQLLSILNSDTFLSSLIGFLKITLLRENQSISCASLKAKFILKLVFSIKCHWRIQNPVKYLSCSVSRK